MATSFAQNIRFRSIPESIEEQFNFVGGLITDKHETKLESNQSPNMANIVLNDTGSIKTRNGYTGYNNISISSASDEANTGTSTATITLDAIGDYAAQTFQVGTEADLVRASFYLAMANSGEEQYVRAELWSGSTGPSTLIASGQVKLVSGTSETEYTFKFIVPQTLAATTEYAIVLKPFARGSAQTVNSVLAHRTGAAYGSGAAYISIDSGLNWSAVSSADLKFEIFTATASPTTGLVRYYGPSGIQQLLAKYGSSIYRGNDSTGVMTAITFASGVTLNADNFIDYTVSNNTLLLVDGENRIKKYNGSTNADYSTGTITVTNGSATITGSSTVWNTSTNATVGEYIQLPDSKWYKITAIASDTSLTIELNYQGSTLAGQSYVISPWGEVQGKLNTSTAVTSLVRPTPDFIENHLNRIWTLDGNTLRFSVLDTSVTEENFNDWDTSSNAGTIIIPGGNGDTGTGLYSLNGYLYIFQRHAIWELLGTTLNNFELRNVSNEVGMIDKRTLIEFDKYLIFFSGEDVYLFDGANLRNLSKGKVKSLIDTWANITSPAATLWNNRYIISYTPSGASSNSEALMYDIATDTWTRHTNIYASCWSQWNGGTDNNEVYFASSVQGLIHKWDVGGNDDGYPIPTLYDMPSSGFTKNINDKSIKKFFIQQLAKGDWDMTVAQLSDIDTNEISADINLSAGDSALWGVAQWGVDEWSSETAIITTRIPEFQGLAKFFKYRFTQEGYDEGIEILGMTASARTRRLS